VSETLSSDTVVAPVVSGRLRSLDGLRGIAAFIVVLHHCMLTWIPFATTYVPGEPGAPVGSVVWWLTETPFKLLTAGGEAVTIFFVLSGVVLTVPTLGTKRFDWWGYYPRRLVRLYVPAIAAVLLAGVLGWVLPNGAPQTAASWWTISSTVRHPSANLVLSAMDLLDGSPVIDNPLWSLKWEVLFSLLLPAIIGVAVFSKRRPWIAVLLAAVAIGIGVELGDGSLMYLPVFIGGAAIAVSLPALRERAARFNRRSMSPLWWLLILIGSLIALILYWMVRPEADTHEFFAAALRALSMLGAVVLVVVAALWSPVARVLTTRVVQWLGRISFSLYLVHVPILITFNAFLGPRLWWISAICTVVTSLIVAELFARLIEQPAHRLSQRTGRFFSQLMQHEKGAGEDLVQTGSNQAPAEHTRADQRSAD
jgi:peptidoglycan/LPS O-acetylase OafA/YrhL